MDQQTRNEFEHLCAPAKLEENAGTFVEIKSNIIRLLDAREVLLNRRPPSVKDLAKSCIQHSDDERTQSG